MRRDCTQAAKKSHRSAAGIDARMAPMQVPFRAGQADITIPAAPNNKNPVRDKLYIAINYI